MKLRNLSLCGLLLSALLFITSCSRESATDGLLAHIPGDADMVIVVSPETVMESAGGSLDESGITFPKYFADSMPESYISEYKQAASSSGVAADAVAVFANYRDTRPIVLVRIADKAAFDKKLGDNDFSKINTSDDVDYYSKKTYESTYSDEYDDYTYVAVDGDYAYMIFDCWNGSTFKPLDVISERVAAARKASFAENKVSSYITSANAAGAAFSIPRALRNEVRAEGVPSQLMNFLSGWVCVKLSVHGDVADAELKCFDEQGDARDLSSLFPMVNTGAKVNAKALSHIGKDEQIVYAASMKDIDWGTYFDFMDEFGSLGRSDRAALLVAKSYLEKIDGTLAVGLGYNGNFSEIYNIFKGETPDFSKLSFTLVVETKKDQAKPLLSDIRNILGAIGVQVSGSSDGFTLSLPGVPFSIVATATDEDRIIISNRADVKSSENFAVKEFDFGNYIAAAVLALNREGLLMQDLGENEDVLLSVVTDIKDSCVKAQLKISGKGSDGVVAKAAKLIISISDRASAIKREYYSRYRCPDLNNYYDDDEVVEAEIVEAE